MGCFFVDSLFTPSYFDPENYIFTLKIKIKTIFILSYQSFKLAGEGIRKIHVSPPPVSDQYLPLCFLIKNA